MSVYISGSLAFDRIMSFSGRFEDHILPEKIHTLNVSFLIEHVEEKRGGTAGNIAYTLALLGEKPRILSSAGRDFGPYGRALEALGLPLDGIRLVEEELTAACYLTTDGNSNQINTFHPAAMSVPCGCTFPDLQPDRDLAIVSPGNADDMRALPRLFRERGVPYIYDPGQQIPRLSAEDLLDAVHGSTLLICNEYEMELIRRITGRTAAEIRALTGAVITTLGEEGAVLDAGGSSTRIGTARPERTVDPTGAGDSFRSGLLKGLVSGLDLATSARLGAVCASFCVERAGTQEHRFTRAELTARYEATFGPMPVLAM